MFDTFKKVLFLLLGAVLSSPSDVLASFNNQVQMCAKVQEDDFCKVENGSAVCSLRADTKLSNLLSGRQMERLKQL